MSNYTRYKGANTNVGPSPGLWGGSNWNRVVNGEVDGYAWEDHCSFLPASGSKYLRLSADAGASIAEIATEASGVFELTTGGTDNNEASMNFGNSLGVVGKMDAGEGRCWFEARVRLTSVADQGVFVGLKEEGRAVANDLADDTGANADKDYIGFRILTADSDGWDAVYNTAGGGGETIHMEADSNPRTAAVATANTWVKLGMYFDNATCFWFVNGEIVSTTGVAESATNFPDGEEFTPTFAIKTGEGVTKKLQIDWWRYLQTF